MGPIALRPLDQIELHTLMDNYTDLTVMNNDEVVTRGGYPADGGTKRPLLAEHGFSLLIRTQRCGERGTLIFDGGFSPAGAAQNARSLGLDLKKVDCFVLSHGHADHWGGLRALAKATGHSRLPLVVHPEAFRTGRHSISKGIIYRMPQLTRPYLEKAGFELWENRKPCRILQGDALFLGEIPRSTDFEQNERHAYYRENGWNKEDDFLDDSSLALLLRGKGLVIVTGCAHAGIINTIQQARKITGESRVFAVIGGFHLTGKTKKQLEPLLEALRQCAPRYVIPCHCTGRKASLWIEETMPEAFLLNMSGTKFTFSGSD
ncbi:MAG: MBL fold metallo-hydrolase [Deltaproteobacteria bacterium]|jgi:7,8-dihydropterin-6-yl-methyl-4-(beta-D-ribofuranosyl)aminobenzene 5'-phosphate synthase|nr:MBL fold metallo-hydrolase [Deltaproteobacteria bacterium]